VTNLANLKASSQEVDPFRLQLERDYANQLTAIDDYERRAVDEMPSPIDSDEKNSVVSDFLVEMRTRHKELDKLHDAEKAPFLKGGRIVDNFFKDIQAKIEAIGHELVKEQKAYLTAKEARARAAREAEERRRREEADRLRREAEDARRAQREAEERARAAAAAAQASERARLQAEKAQKEAEALAAKAQAAQEASAAHTVAASEMAEKTESMKPADFARTRSTSSQSMSTLKEVWAFEIDDFDKVDLNKLRGNFKRADVEKAVRQYVQNGGRELAGVRIYSEREVVNR